VYLKEGTYHTRLFRGPSTNGMKKWDGPSRSWPTPHTTPLASFRVFFGPVGARGVFSLINETFSRESR